MSEMKAAICENGSWKLTDDVNAIFAAGENAIFVTSNEALKAELQKRHDGGLEPGLTKVNSQLYGYEKLIFLIEDEPLVDPDKIKTQEQLEALCRKVGTVNIYNWRHQHEGYDRDRYNDHPEFIATWESLTYNPAKKRGILKRIKASQERLDRMGVVRQTDLYNVLGCLHTALRSTSFDVAIERYRLPKKKTELLTAIVECYKVATFLQVRHKARANKEWKEALTNIAPLLRKFAKSKESNRDFITIATNEYRLAGINIRTKNKETKHGKVQEQRAA